MAIYTTVLYHGNNSLQQSKTPSLAGEGWGEEIKINYSLIPTFSLKAWVSTQLFYSVKTMGCNSAKPPLLLDKSARSGFGRSESAHRVPGRIARKHWVGERSIKSTGYIPPHPSPFDTAQDRLLPQGRRGIRFCRFLCPQAESSRCLYRFHGAGLKTA